MQSEQESYRNKNKRSEGVANSSQKLNSIVERVTGMFPYKTYDNCVFLRSYYNILVFFSFLFSVTGR